MRLCLSSPRPHPLPSGVVCVHCNLFDCVFHARKIYNLTSACQHDLTRYLHIEAEWWMGLNRAEFARTKWPSWKSSKSLNAAMCSTPNVFNGWGELFPSYNTNMKWMRAIHIRILIVCDSSLLSFISLHFNRDTIRGKLKCPLCREFLKSRKKIPLRRCYEWCRRTDSDRIFIQCIDCHRLIHKECIYTEVPDRYVCVMCNILRF